MYECDNLINITILTKTQTLLSMFEIHNHFTINK